MRRNRWTIALLLATLLCLCACGEAENTETASVESEEETAEIVTEEPEEEAPVSEDAEEEAPSEAAVAGPEEEEKTTLYLADMSNNKYLRDAIQDFNALSEEYELEQVLYTSNDETRLRLELISGSGPDLMSLNGFGYEAYANKGVFVDLNTCFENDPSISRDVLVEQVLDACEEEDGQLFQLMPSFVIETMWCNPVFLETLGEWNMETIEQWLNDHSDAAFTNYTETYNSPFYLLMRAGLNDFVDYDTMTCSFDSEEFRTLLKNAKDWSANNSDPTPQDYEEGLTVACYFKLSSFSDLQSLVDYGLTQPVGFPTQTGGSTQVSSVIRLTICAGTSHEDAAWEFLKVTLSEEYQEDAPWLPILKSVFDQQAQDAMGTTTQTVVQYGDDPEKIASGESDASITTRSVEVDGLTQDEVDILYDLLDQLDSLQGDVSGDIMGIVEEEAEAYLNGDRSVEDVTDYMQDRISTLLAERS